jgi:menaquinone-dependent protoporphyrinogen IX oxidase
MGATPSCDETRTQMARALAAHLRQRRTRDVERAEDVRLEQFAHVVVGELLERAEQPVAGVVDHHVDAAEGIETIRIVL